MLCSFQDSNPLEHSWHVGVAIKGMSPTQNHVGILYRVGADLHLSHLLWHHVLRDEIVTGGYLWATCGMFQEDDINGQAFAGRLLSIRDSGGFVPYGFYAEGNAFDINGTFVPFTDPAMGLTCATYVVQVFQSFGYPIIDIGTWETRDDDEHWQRSILDAIAEHVSQERADEAANYVGAVRVRPEEAAAAVMNEPAPINFNRAKEMAEEIQMLLAQATY